MLNFIEYSDNTKYKAGIYCITNTVDDRIYIGSTKCFYSRFYNHNRDFSLNRHNNPHFQNFVNKYGIDVLDYKIIEIIDFDLLLEREQYYLDNYIDFNKDFNICKIVGTPPNYNRQFNEENIKEIAELYNSGISCCRISETLFDNRSKRSLISKIIKGEYYSEYNHYFKYRKYSQKGRKLSQETKNKISSKNKGKYKDISSEQISFIKENISKYSGRYLSKLTGISKTMMSNLIKDIKNGLHIQI